MKLSEATPVIFSLLAAAFAPLACGGSDSSTAGGNGGDGGAGSDGDVNGGDAGTTGDGGSGGDGGGTSFPPGTVCNSSGTPLTAPATLKHVIVILFENENYGSVNGSATKAPYINSL